MEAEANISPRAGNQTRPKQKVLAGLPLTPSAVQLQNCAKKKLVVNSCPSACLLRDLWGSRVLAHTLQAIHGA